MLFRSIPAAGYGRGDQGPHGYKHKCESDFSNLNGIFDIIIVDAPCSGEGMFRKDPNSIDEWSLENVNLCCERQKRIVVDVFPALKDGGFLIYSTCTYNNEENEDNIKWIRENLGAEYIPIYLDKSWNISDSGLGYHFYPHKTRGEGFFISVLQKNIEEKSVKLKTNKYKNTPKITVPSDLKNWILSDDFQLNNEGNLISAIPKQYSELISFLNDRLRVLQSGIYMATIKGKDILPEIAMALSVQINKNNFECIDLSWQQAIAYLRKENIFIDNLPKGKLLMQYKNIPLGWAKNLGNRMNNSFPQEWRIRMEADESRYTPFL